jgi:hypothetical protein
VTLAALSLAVYGGVLTWSCVLAPHIAPLTLFLGGAGALLLGVMLVRGVDELLGSALLLLAAAYVLGLLVGRRPLDEGAPLVAAGLLLCAELATWSLELRLRITLDPALRLQRVRAVGLLVLAGLAAASFVLVVAATSIGGGLAWAVLGSAAAVGAIALAAFVRS